jgi:hypothetical protein
VTVDGEPRDDHQSALALFDEAMGFTYAAALRAAAVIGVADHLDRARTAAELAVATGTDAQALYRTLRLLVTRNVLDEDDAGRFSLTTKGAALRTDAPLSARSAILMFTDGMFWNTTHELATTLRDKESTFAGIFGTPLAEYFASDSAKESLFYEGMETVSDAENPLIAQGCEFPSTGTVADIGGRHGALLLAVLRRNPGLQGVLFDAEQYVLDRHRLGAQDIAGRWKIVHGDFFAEVPAADVYLLKRILHNWDDEQSVRILRNCRTAMHPGGRVIVVDAIVPPGNTPHQSKEMDFMMLAAHTGQERTEAELGRVFATAGLRLTRVIPTESVMAIAEGVPA